MNKELIKFLQTYGNTYSNDKWISCKYMNEEELLQLQTLKLFSNQLTQLPESIGQLVQLRGLYLSDNKLTQLPESIGQLLQLQHLSLSNNQLTCLPESMGQLIQLQTLYLFHNQLTQLPESIGQLVQLKVLGLSSNQLTQLSESIGKLVQLQTLDLCNNKLTQLPENIERLTQLRELHLSYNQLTQLPLFLIYMPNLCYFYYSRNEITNLHPAITRWLNRSKTTQNVYNNSQSVHDHNIEATTNESIKKFVSSYKCNTAFTENLIDNINVSQTTKNLLKSYAASDYVHSRLQLSFAEVLVPVIDFITNNTNKEELLKILDEEMQASKDKCFQGRLSRLINVLNGYHESVNIQISDNEQIGNIIIKLREKYTNLEELIEKIREELQERNYEASSIDEWIGYAKENY